MSAPATPMTTPDRLPPSVYLLMCAQALAGALPPIMVSLGGLIGQTLAPSPLLVTLPVSMFMIGTCLATVPVAMLIRQFGRRNVYLAGALVATCGALLCMEGVLKGNFALLCAGALLFGLNIACVQSYRYAAAQAVLPGQRPRAISLVLLGGIGSAVIGPQVAIHADILPLAVPHASAFAGQALIAFCTLPFLLALRLPPAPLPAPDLRADQPRQGLARRFPVSRSFFVAVICGAFAYGSMTFTMTAAPLAMVACGLGADNAALGIQWHIIGMFAPSLITGRLIGRFGHLPIAVSGIAIVVLGAIVSLSGQGLAHFWITLVLLGIGWNFAYTGSTVMIAQASARAGSVALQGLGDFLIFAFVAAASLLAGVIFQLSGWMQINLAVMVTLLIMLALIWSERRRAA
ncbi:MFS transporter [Pseudooceanicola sp. GBMRC 2024]|uniref:MFS transporter n=1 Tax=Pseudooceanicola albus TaxID=2692189 RepID=A0A6L7G1H2_9RHOB|nr:MFS transporter [Pseudooceanicola albus]MXN17895.1 MFS transporter [Pseudooceanicola albus]